MPTGDETSQPVATDSSLHSGVPTTESWSLAGSPLEPTAGQPTPNVPPWPGGWPVQGLTPPGATARGPASIHLHRTRPCRRGRLRLAVRLLVRPSRLCLCLSKSMRWTSPVSMRLVEPPAGLPRPRSEPLPLPLPLGSCPLRIRALSTRNTRSPRGNRFPGYPTC